jgi:hypothetical protein
MSGRTPMRADMKVCIIRPPLSCFLTTDIATKSSEVKTTNHNGWIQRWDWRLWRYYRRTPRGTEHHQMLGGRFPSHSKVLFVTRQFELWEQLTSYGVVSRKFSNGRPGRVYYIAGIRFDSVARQKMTPCGLYTLGHIKVSPNLLIRSS